MAKNVPFVERLWAGAKADGTGCWPWQKYRGAWGYGQIGRDGKVVLAHRAAYEIVKGQIPDGLTLDHLCRNPPCINPSHLEPVTQRENLLRGEGPSARNARKTHCKHGHEFSETNTYIYPANSAGAGRRRCRTCHLQRQRQSRVSSVGTC